MKSILVLTVCCGLSALAFAGTEAKLSDQSGRTFNARSLDSGPIMPEAEVLPVLTESSSPIEASRLDSIVPKGDLSIEETLYGQMKSMNEDIPVWLQEAVFGPRVIGTPSRDGGDDSATAIPIPFAAGSTYLDSGDTSTKTDVMPFYQLPPFACDGGQNYGSFGAPDAWYSFTLPDFHEVSVNTCGSSAFDTCLGIFNADLNLMAVADDGCSVFPYSSRIDPCCLPPGTYYVVVDGSDSYWYGAYSLEVIFGDTPCVPEAPCDDFTAIALPFSGTGTNLGAPDLYGSGAGDVGYTFTLAEESVVSLNTCLEGTTFDVDSYLFSGNPCDGGPQLFYNDGDATCQFASYPTVWDISCTAPLAAGTYTVLLTGYQTQEGTYSLTIDATPTVEACGCGEVLCDGTAEVEDNDSYAMAQNIVCGETVCGTTFIQGDTLRDVDIFELLLPEDNILTIDVLAGEFNALVQLVAEDTTTVLAEVDAADFCRDEQLVSNCLQAGTYYVLVAHNAFNNIDGSADYALTVNCAPCTWLPPCEAALPLTCGDVVAGDNTGNANYVGWPSGDQFFVVTMPVDGLATFTLCDGMTFIYRSWMHLYDSCPTDPGAVELTVDRGNCGQPSMAAVLNAGTYYLVLEGTHDYEGVFSLSMTCGSCEPIACEGTPEVEPNGGNGMYGTIADGETVCGTTFTSNDTRDTDWYEIDLAVDSYLDIHADVEEFNAQLVVMDACESVLAVVDAAGFCQDETLVTDCLAAGTYYVFISHNAFSGVATPANYGLSVSSTPCDDAAPIPYVDCQPVTSVDGAWSFGLSEAGFYNRYERFGGVSGPMTHVEFEGLNLTENFEICTEDPTPFWITFHEADLCGRGAIVAGFELSALGVPTGNLYEGSLNSLAFSVELPSPVALSDGYISIQGIGDPACRFWWASAGETGVVSDGVSVLADANYNESVDGYDLNYCLISQPACGVPENVSIIHLLGDANDYWEANLFWDPVAGAVSYDVYASTDATGPFDLIGSTSGPFYLDTGELIHGRRCYKVVAVCD